MERKKANEESFAFLKSTQKTIKLLLEKNKNSFWLKEKE